MNRYEDLRTLILENPELPVVVVSSGKGKNICVNPFGRIGKMIEHDGKIYIDRENFAELDEAVWTKCIITEFWRN